MSPEEQAIDVLGSRLFPAQFQFQSGNVCDQDGDQVGEYGTLAELTGVVAPPGGAEASVYADGFTGNAVALA